MARRHRNRRRTMRGGFLDTLSNWGSSLTQSASSLWEKTKSATSGLTSSSVSSGSNTYTSTPSYTAQPMSYGGKTRRRRKMRGGFKDNTPTTGLASTAASFSGPTAKAHTMVGGKTKKRGRKSRKHRMR